MVPIHIVANPASNNTTLIQIGLNTAHQGMFITLDIFNTRKIDTSATTITLIVLLFV